MTFSDCSEEKNILLLESFQIRSFFWSVFPRIRTENGDLRNKSLYSFQIWQIVDQQKLRIRTFFTQWEKRKKDFVKYL